MTNRSTPFAAIVAAMKRAQPQRHAAEAEQRTRERARVPYAAAKAAADANFAVTLEIIAAHRERVRTPQPEPADTWADDVTASVMRAAALRDAGGPPLPDLDGVAAEIIEAGKRRRGEL